jgi:F1F0 ATPase subunit 2
MTRLPVLLLDLTAGICIGLIFYGGLWWTVRRIHAHAAGLWLMGSFLVRTIIALTGFYVVARDNGYAATACFAGFIVARILVTYVTRGSAVPGAPGTLRSARDGSRSGP